MLSIDMSWGATAKEAKRTSFFAEIPTILKKFKFTFVFCIIMVSARSYLISFSTPHPLSLPPEKRLPADNKVKQTTAMIVFAGVGPVGAFVPYDWRINSFTAIFPISTLVAFHFVSFCPSPFFTSKILQSLFPPTYPANIGPTQLMPLVLNPGLMQFTF
jgi:hypothetical protein